MKALIERLIVEFLEGGDERLDWVKPTARAHGFLPLHIGWLVVLGIRPDLSFVTWDHEDTRAVTPLLDLKERRDAICDGARRYLEIGQLLPARPVAAVECPSCQGWGRHPTLLDLICACMGLGWVEAEEGGAAPPRVDREWLAIDADGALAVLDTVGGGFTPALDGDDAIDELLAGPPTTRPRFAPDAPEHTATLAAERGLYAYEADPNGGPYRIVAAPAVATRRSEVPRGAVRLPEVRFAGTPVITKRWLGG